MEGRVRTKQFRLRMQDKEEPYGAHGYIGGTCFLLQIKQAAFDPRVFQNPSRDACFGVIDSIHELFDQADAGHGGQFPNPEDLASIAVERKCGRLEWRLDWNSPSVDFYLSLGGGPMWDWAVYRTACDTLGKFAEKDSLILQRNTEN